MVCFEHIIEYLQEMNLEVDYISPEDQILIINDEAKALKNMLCTYADPILIIEQEIMPNSPRMTAEHYKRLLRMNRQLVHGAFVIDDAEEHIIFRDTLQVENLDFNELEGSINALTLFLAEFADELIALSKV